ncbi:MAG: hypothetical protein ABT03_09820 [Comamonas sp. SCN 67-35]|nr:MAG: hypothetical protein ABT03_09820 [Comamonas sp. SCN 67-35]OJX03666.1 MAG: hypothetical protein BGO73_13370 [Burkholderiales bacterium 66-26]
MVTDPSSAALRAIAVLEAVAGAPGAQTLSDLMAATGLAKPTAHRIAHLLEDAGLLVREPDGKRYAPGPRLSAMALQVLAGSHWNAPRHAILQSLVQRLGETCNLTMLDGAQVVYLDRVETQWPLRLSFQPGSRVPAHASASGKLLLALLPARERQRILERLPLQRFTAATITQAQALHEELVRIRKSRVGRDSEEYLDGTVCVAVPVEDGALRVPAALAVHAPLPRMSLEQAMGHVPLLREAAAQLAHTFSLGGPS